MNLTFDPTTHTYQIDGEVVPSVTQIIAAAGLMGDCSHFRPEHAERGTHVHTACALMDDDDLDPASIDPALSGYLDAYKRFTRENEWLPYLSEHPMGSARHGFAGQIDDFGMLNGRVVLLDKKTGAYQRHHDIQMAGYAILWEENRKALGLESPDYRVILQLSQDGKYKLHQPKISNRDADAVFMAALALGKPETSEETRETSELVIKHFMETKG